MLTGFPRPLQSLCLHREGGAIRAALEVEGLLLTAEIGGAFPEETGCSRNTFGANEASVSCVTALPEVLCADLLQRLDGRTRMIFMKGCPLGTKGYPIPISWQREQSWERAAQSRIGVLHVLKT